MTGKELRELVNKGMNPIVEFTESVEEIEERFDKGMRAYVTKVSYPDNSDCVEVTFEERDFSEYNKNIEKPNWYNNDTEKYDLKFSETKNALNYKGVISFYEMENEELCNFQIVENKSLKLFSEYQNSNEQILYVKWLENIVLGLK